MGQPWIAQEEVSSELAQALIETQFPQLAPARAELLGAGWDNTAFQVNERYVFRFPRRKIAVALLDAENRLLPFLAPRLPLPIPVPLFVGEPESRFGWPFAGYAMLPGQVASDVGLSEAEREAAAIPIARFLASLHAIPAEEALRQGAGGDTFDKLNLAKNVPVARQRLEQFIQMGLVSNVRPLLTFLDSLAGAVPQGKQILVHGDLYARHLLVSEERHLAGVIDWGDVHVGHPALDLSIAHGFLPPSAQESFCRAYGDIEEETWRLARFRALTHTAAVVAYAADIGDAALLHEGLTSLSHLSLA